MVCSSFFPETGLIVLSVLLCMIMEERLRKVKGKHNVYRASQSKRRGHPFERAAFLQGDCSTARWTIGNLRWGKTVSCACSRRVVDHAEPGPYCGIYALLGR